MNDDGGDDDADEEPQELSAYAFGCGANTGPGGQGFGTGNTCATGKKKITIERANKDKSFTVTFESGEDVDIFFADGSHRKATILSELKSGKISVRITHPTGSYKATVTKGEVYKAGDLIERKEAPKKKTKAISKAIDKLNDKYGEGLTEADAVPLEWR